MCGGFVGSIIGDVVNPIESVVGAVSGVFSGIANDIESGIESLPGAVSAGISGFESDISSVASDIGDLGSIAASTIGGVVSFVDTEFNDATQFISQAVQSAESDFDALEQGATSFLKQYGHVLLDVAANVICPGSSLLIDALWYEAQNGWKTPSLSELGQVAAEAAIDEVAPGVDSALSDVLPDAAADVASNVVSNALNTYATTGKLPTGQSLLEGAASSVLGDAVSSGLVESVSDSVTSALSDILPGLGDGVELVQNVAGVITEVEDSVAAIESLTPLQIIGLSGLDVPGLADITAITSLYGSVALDAAQVLALEAAGIYVAVPLGDAVTLVDTAAQIADYTPAQIAALATVGVSQIEAVASSQVLVNLADAQALATAGLQVIDSGGAVALADAASVVEGVDPAQIAALAQVGVTEISAGKSVAFDLSQALALAASGIDVQTPAGDVASVLDSTADIQSLTSGDIADLKAVGLSAITTANASVVLDLAQASELLSTGLKISAPVGDLVQISDATAALQALSTSEIAGLQAAGVQVIAAQTSIAVSIDQLRALEQSGLSLAVPAGDLASLSGDASAIEGLSAGQIKAMAAAGLDQLDVLDASVSLDLAQAEAAAAAKLSVAIPTGDIASIADTAADFLGLTVTQIAALKSTEFTSWTVNDTAAQLLALAPGQFATLASIGVSAVDVTDSIQDLLSLTSANIAQLTADGVGAWAVADTAANIVGQDSDLGTFSEPIGAITVVDSAADILALTATSLGELKADGVTTLTAIAAPLVVTSLSFLATIEADGLNLQAGVGDLVTLSASASALEGLGASAFAGLGAAGVGAVDVTAGSLVLTAQQALTLATAQVQISLASGASVSLVDSSADIGALTAAQFAALGEISVSRIQSDYGAIVLDVAQLEALQNAGISVQTGGAGPSVLLSDTASHIEALSATQISDLVFLGVRDFEATDSTLNLTLAQALAFATGSALLSAPPTSPVQVLDTAADLQTLTPSQIDGIRKAGVTSLISPLSSVTFDLAQILALSAEGIDTRAGPGGRVILADGAASIAGYTLGQIAQIAQAGVTQISATDGAATVDTAQALAFASASVDISATVADAALSVEALTAAQIAGLGPVGVTQVAVTDATLTLTVAQVLAFESAGVTLSAPTGDAVVLADSAAAIESLTEAEIADLARTGVTMVTDTSGALSLTASQVEGLAGDGLHVALADTASDIESLTPAQIGAVAAGGAASIISTDGEVQFSVQQTLALLANDLTVTAGGYEVLLADTAANLLGLTGFQLAEAQQAGILGEAVADSVAALDALPTSEINVLKYQSVTWTVDDTIADFLSLAESLQAASYSGTLAPLAAMLSANGIYLTQLTVTDTATQFESLTPAEISTIYGIGLLLAESGGLQFTNFAGVKPGLAFVATGGSLVLDQAQVSAIIAGNDDGLYPEKIPIAVAAGDTISIADTPANLEFLAYDYGADDGQSDLAEMASLGVSAITATAPGLTLDVGEAEALPSSGFFINGYQGGGVLLSDSPETIEALTPAQITAFGALGFTAIQATSDSGPLDLSAAQLLAAAAAHMTVSARVPINADESINLGPTLVDTTLAIEALTPAQLSALGAVGVLVLQTSSTGSLVLDVAQALAALRSGILGYVPGEFGLVEVSDTFANLESLTPGDISLLAGGGVRQLTGSEDTTSSVSISLSGVADDLVLTFSLDQALAIADSDLTVSATLDHFPPTTGVHDGVITVGFAAVVASDPAGDLENLSVAQIEALSAAGITGLTATDTSLSFDVAQVVAFEQPPDAMGFSRFVLSVPSGDAINVADTAAAIEALTPAQLTGLEALGVTRIDVTDTDLTLNVAQATAAGAAGVSIGLSPGDGVAIIDSAANLLTLTSTQVAGLAALSVTSLHGVDTVADLIALTDAQVATLKADGVDAWTVQDTVTNLSNITADDLAILKPLGALSYAVADSAADIEALTPTQLGGLAYLGVTTIDCDTGSLVLDPTLAGDLQSDGFTVTVPAGDTVTVSASGASVASLERALVVATHKTVDLVSQITGTTIQAAAVVPSPSEGVPAGQTLPASGPLAFAAASGDPITISGGAYAGAMTTTLAIGAGELTVTAASGATVVDDGGDLVTITGTAAQIDATLATLTAQTPNAAGQTLTLQTSDPGGTATASIVLAGSDLGPSESLPTGQIVDAAGQTLFGAAEGDAITVSEAGPATLTTNLSVQDGVLSVSYVGGLTVVGQDSASLTLTGDAANIDAALGGLVYQANLGFAGSDTLEVATTDGDLSTSDRISLTSSAASLAPAVILPGGETVGATGTLAFNPAGGDAITVEGGAPGAELMTTVAVEGGVLGATAQGAATVTPAANGESVEIVGSAQDTNATLATLVYDRSAGFFGADQLTVTTSDGTLGVTAATVLSSAPDQAPVNTTPAGDLTLGSSGELAFDTADQDAILVDAASGASLSVTLGARYGVLSANQEGDDQVRSETLASGVNTLTLTGSAPDIDASLQTLVYQASAGFEGQDSLVISTSDGVFDTVSSVGLRSAQPYLAPGVALSGGLSVAAGGQLAFPSGALEVNDVDGAVLTTTVSVASTFGALEATAEGVATVTSAASNGTSTITITGSATDTNLVLGTLDLQATPGVSGAGTLYLSTSDGVQRVQGSAQIAVSGPQADQAPGETLPSGQVLSAGGAIAFDTADANAITVSDGAAAEVTVTLSVGAGALTVTATPGVTLDGQSGLTSLAAPELTIAGTAAAVNASLNTLSYQEHAGQNGGDTLSVSVSDGVLSASGEVVLTGVDSAPVVVAPGAQSLSAGGSVTFGSAEGDALSLADASSDTLTADLSVEHGTLALGPNTPPGVTVDGANPGEIVLGGTAAGIDLALDGLSYQANPGYGGYDQLRVNVTADNGQLSAVGTVGLSPVALAPAPSESVPAGQVVDSQGQAAFDPAAGNALTVGYGTDATLTTTVSVAHGALSVTGEDGVSPDSTGSSLTIVGSAEAITATLATLVYQRQAGYAGADLLTIDTSNGAFDTSDQVELTDAPVAGPGVTTPGAQTIGASGQVAFRGADAIAVTDPAGHTLTVDLTVADGTLTATAQGSAQVSGSGGSLEVTGSAQDIDTTLATLVYQESSGDHGSDALNVSAIDGTSSAAGVVLLRSTDPGPGESLTGGQVIGASGDLDFDPAPTVSDAPGYSLVTTLTVQHGALSATAQGQATVVAGGATLTIAGSAADTNSTLATLSYQQDPGYLGGDTLAMTTSDGAVSMTQSVTLGSDQIGVVNAQTAAAGVVLGGSATSGGQVDVQLYDQNGAEVAGQSYSANVVNGVWTVTLNLTGLADGAYEAAESENVSGSAPALQPIVVHQTAPTVAIDPIAGGTLTLTQAEAGVSMIGSVTGLAAGSQFQIHVTDGTFAKSFTAIVGSNATTWSAAIDPDDAVQLGAGVATATASVTDAYGNTSAEATQTFNVSIDSLSESAAAISAGLDAIEGDSQLGLVIVSDNQPVVLDAAQLTTDASALSLLRNADGAPPALDVEDTAANISRYLGALNADSAIGQIVVLDSLPLSLTPTQTSDDQHAISLISNADGGPVVIGTAILPTDDFTGAGFSNILIENTDGAVVVGALGAGGQETYTQVAALGPEWTFVGTGDFLGYGQSDFLIENTSGAVAVGEVSGGQTTYTPVTALGSEWSFVGAGDFLGDGRADFLIENSAGSVVVGEVVNGQTQYSQVTALGPEWSFVGTGDFLGDGKSDFLIENTAGAVFVGEVVNGQAQYAQVAALGPEWRFVETGDFLGDGKSDVLIENAAGAVVVGEVVNGQAAYTTVGGLGPEWSFIGAGDYSGTGVDSFLIENTAGALFTGTVVNGQAQYAQIGALGPEWRFHG